MSDTDSSQPATKADLNSLKTDVNSLESKLRTEIQDVKSELKTDLKNLSGEILKNNFKIDRLTDRLDTEFATKADINQIFNLLDPIAGNIKRYQREDTLRGDAVMRHDKQLAGHETRITLLEEKK